MSSRLFLTYIHTRRSIDVTACVVCCMLHCWLFTPDIQGGWLPAIKGSMVLISEEIMSHFLPKILGMTVTVGIIPFRAFK